MEEFPLWSMGIISSVLNESSAQKVEGEVPFARSVVELASDLKAASSLCSHFANKDGSVLRFSARMLRDDEVPHQHVDLSSFLVDQPWKARVRILVKKGPVKADADRQDVDVRTLNFFQFYKVFELMNQVVLRSDVSGPSKTEEPPKTASNAEDEDDSLCPVCLDNPAVIILPDCNHAFCEDCLAAWKLRSDTCPLCRRAADAQSDEVWVLTGDGPAKDELCDYFEKIISEI